MRQHPGSSYFNAFGLFKVLKTWNYQLSYYLPLIKWTPWCTSGNEWHDLINKVTNVVLEHNLLSNYVMFRSPPTPPPQHPGPTSPWCPSVPHGDSHYRNDAPRHFLSKWKCTNRWLRRPLGKSILISTGNICLCALVARRDLTAKFNVKG